jgi:hypothetical protein
VSLASSLVMAPRYSETALDPRHDRRNGPTRKDRSHWRACIDLADPAIEMLGEP